MDSSKQADGKGIDYSTKSYTIRWRKGELIGAGAFGSVYMGMNLDSGELLAVKQVLISAKNVAKERFQAHLKELEDEVKLLQNLSHPNIVRYLGTAREDDALNIFLEFVPGGSIASLLGKFGSFPEQVIRMYSRQLLQGLEYLHKNGIMHRDIKGANILVDNKGCIKLADFGASKQVVELVTMSGAKSMKGTPYWMAPEVIRQTGHSLPADIWSVGCTIIEMATGKAPWSQQFQEVAALFHIGTTKSHPPIPEHLSCEAKDFLQKCLRKEPYLRPTVSELLQHPFIHVDRSSMTSASIEVPRWSQNFQSCKKRMMSQSPFEELGVKRTASMCRNPSAEDSSFKGSSCRELFESNSNCSVRLDCDSYSTKNFESARAEPFQFFALGCQSVNNSSLEPSSFFKPMHEPDTDDGWCNISNPELKENRRIENSPKLGSRLSLHKYDADFSFKCSLPVDNIEDEDEVTESKIQAFLDEKAMELKRLQTPLYLEFENIWNVEGKFNEQKDISHDARCGKSGTIDGLRSVLEPKLTLQSDTWSSKKSGRSGLSIACSCKSEATVSSDSPRLNELKRLLLETQQPLRSPSSLNSYERQRLWKEELQQELEIRRERKLLSQIAGNRSKPSPRKVASYRERSVRTSSAKKLPTMRTMLMMPSTPSSSLQINQEASPIV
ncbi:hypothetical protein KP509_04G009300 [Ceratopteris richardii]|uniref:mitogen-activated protein kinase kinase kinase n=1 Tax=Ceratopteris richardii TaxID=49495 RepID=A0A8T2USK1_CERRI|nr:hypothetical protein KP509_04G009300 [Ceratopteris richardii]